MNTSIAKAHSSMTSETRGRKSSHMARVDEVMSYQFPALVARIRKKLGLTEQVARELFEDTKRFLYLCGTSEKPIAPNTVLDFGWHQFILFTEEYTEFCIKHFGRFIHHRPALPDDSMSKHDMSKNTEVLAQKVFGNTLSANWYFPNTVGNAGPCDSCGCSPSD